MAAENGEARIHENGSLSDGVQTQPTSTSSLPDSKVAAEDSGTGSSLESSDKDRSESMHTEPSDDIDEENQLEAVGADDDFSLRLEEESSCDQDSQMSANPPADEDVDAADVTPTARNPGSTPSSPSSGKSNPRVPRYPSIIRTRKRVEQQGAEELAEYVSSSKRNRHSSGDQSVMPAKVAHAEEANKMDDANGDQRDLSVRGGKKPGRGRGRGGIKRPRSLECPVPTQPSQKVKSPSDVSPPMSAPTSKRGRTRASPAKPRRSPVRTMTRATTAEMKKVQFLSLPGRKRRRKGGQQGDEEEYEEEEERDDIMEVPLVKKNKKDEDTEDGIEEGVLGKEEEHVDDKEGDEEKDLCEEKEDKDPTLDSPPSKGRGGYRRSAKRGRRGRGGKGVAPPTLSEVKQDSSEQPEEEQAPEAEASSLAKEEKVEPELPQQQQEEKKTKEDLKVKGKKRRGRPPRRPKDDSTSGSTSCAAVAEDDMDVALKARPVPVSEPLKNPDQIVELLQLSETMEGGRVTPPDKDESSTPDKMDPKKPSSEITPTKLPKDPESSHANLESGKKAAAIDTQKTTTVMAPAEVEEQMTPAEESLPDEGDKKGNSSDAAPPPSHVSTAAAAMAPVPEVSEIADSIHLHEQLH